MRDAAEAESEPEESDEPEVQTADSLAEKLQDLVSEFSTVIPVGLCFSLTAVSNLFTL